MKIETLSDLSGAAGKQKLTGMPNNVETDTCNRSARVNKFTI